MTDNNIIIDDVLIKYRRHNYNVSCTSQKSNLSIVEKIKYRLVILINILLRILTNNHEINIRSFTFCRKKNRR